ncbi:MAG: hypothetical protein ABW250_26780 [Pyrinomonadaceae bacterium]
MNVRVTNLQPQPLSLDNGVQLAAAGTDGSTREVAMSERVRKLAEREMIFIHPAAEPLTASATITAPSADGAVTVSARTLSADEKRSRK